MIAIVDYGMGNIRSVEKGFRKVGADVQVTADPAVIGNARGVVLPGVGAFRDCMKNLEDLRLLDTIVKEIGKGKPYLGICLGLQILFSESEEFGTCKGLDIFKGKVVRFNFQSPEQGTQNTDKSLSSGLCPLSSVLKIPHMGWNTVSLRREPPIFAGIPDKSHFYFVHSFYVLPDDREIVAGTTDYGIEFTSMVWKDHVFATQFHPEKSQDLGLKILKGFSDFVSRSS